MLRKIALIFVFVVAFMGCDSDFKQGNCDEGFFEQNTGDGNTYCVPITNTAANGTAIFVVDDFNETD